MYTFENQSKKKLHVQVSERIKAMIQKGGWRQDDKLPSYRNLVKELNVSLVTVKQAMDLLVAEKVIYGHHGKGMFVLNPVKNSSRQIQTIGLIVYCTNNLLFSSDYLMQMFQGIMLAADKLKADVKLISLKKEGAVSVQSLIDKKIDGVVLLAVNNEKYLKDFVQSSIPVVVADFNNPEIPLDYVVCDNEQSGLNCVNELVSFGHKRIAYMDGWSNDTLVLNEKGTHPEVETSDVLERRNVYKSQMDVLGFSEHIKVLGLDLKKEASYIKDVCDHIVSLKQKPSAIIAYDNNLGCELMKELEKVGLNVPGDISIVAMAGAETNVVGAKTLSYCKMPFIEIGTKSVAILKSRCRSLRNTKAKITYMPGQWVTGNTIADIRK
ncbi:MAG: hypothetical protein COA79_11920 [Planctomycetota bacterium]|nr:MAG: hypothetical protein COA79_11920 [Planctomycetota bacterium]